MQGSQGIRGGADVNIVDSTRVGIEAADDGVWRGRWGDCVEGAHLLERQVLGNTVSAHGWLRGMNREIDRDGPGGQKSARRLWVAERPGREHPLEVHGHEVALGPGTTGLGGRRLSQHAFHPDIGRGLRRTGRLACQAGTSQAIPISIEASRDRLIMIVFRVP